MVSGELVVLRKGGLDLRLVEDLDDAQLKHVVRTRMSLPPVRKGFRKKQPVKQPSLLYAKLLAVSVVADEDDLPDIAPRSPEAIVAERKREAGYEREGYPQAEVLHAEGSSQTGLSGWFEKRVVFPVLDRVAGICVAVPVSSGSSERVFSAAGDIVMKKHERLGTGAVSSLVFLRG